MGLGLFTSYALRGSVLFWVPRGSAVQFFLAFKVHE